MPTLTQTYQDMLNTRRDLSEDIKDLELGEEFLSLSLQTLSPEYDDNDLSVDQHISTFIALDQISLDSSNKSDQPVLKVKDLLKQFGLQPLELSITHMDQLQEIDTDVNQDILSLVSKNLSATHRSSDLVVSNLLGVGGMGMVFSGYQNCLNREVAFKVSKNYQKLNSTILAQICHEALITAKLSHARIPPVYLFAMTAKGEPIQVMKKLEGVSWNRLVKNLDDPFWKELSLNTNHERRQRYKDTNKSAKYLSFNLDVLLQVSQAMSYVHDQNIIHRDLKPENIMVGPYGEIHILDWGVSIDMNIQQHYDDDARVLQKLSTIENALVGTPAYMPPEMALKNVEQQGPWTDVFQLGAILYQLWTDHLLYHWNSETSSEIFKLIERGETPEIPEDLPAEVQLLLLDSLHPNPKQRISDAKIFAKRLQEVIDSLESRSMEWKGWASLEADKKFIKEHSNLAEVDLISFNQEVDKRLDYTRNLFWSAKNLWPKNLNAKKGIDQVLAVWIPILINRNEFSCAERLLQTIDLPDKNFQGMWDKIPKRRKTLEAKHSSKAWNLLLGGFVLSSVSTICLLLKLFF